MTVEPQVYYGKYQPCIHDKYNLCEHLKVMGFQTMIQPLVVTIHATKRFNNIKGSKLIVIGAGSIGILLNQFIKALRTEKILINEISKLHLEITKKVDVDYVVNSLNK